MTREKMPFAGKLVSFLFILIYVSRGTSNNSTRESEDVEKFDFEEKQPTVLIAVLVRNKEHTLPYFLSLLQDLNYSKDRVSLWIRSDHNEDKTIQILKKWLKSKGNLYHSTDVILDLNTQNQRMEEEIGPAHWSSARFDHVIQLRESALNYARKIWADYILFLDCDVFLTNPDTLQHLISQNQLVSAPLLRSDGLYSNFWCGMTSKYYYKRTSDYKPILNRERLGCFPVPMIHSCVLVNLRSKLSDFLTFDANKISNYDGPTDDIITFAISANRSGIPLYVCNNYVYGYVMVPLEQNEPLEDDYQQLTNLKVEVLNTEERESDVLRYLYYDSNIFAGDIKEPKKNRMRFDQIYMINLKRRPERRRRMMKCFDELGLEVNIIDAVDGKTLNDSILQEMGITFMSEFSDPYHKRPMTWGEIGCFLSHYKIWNLVVENKYESIMVLEDDIRFEPYFRKKVEQVVNDLKEIPDWDLVYLGRKRLQEFDEPWISRYLVKASYSYWTLGYILSQRGAQKLLSAKPLKNMVPVDEYLPILFDQHPKISWKEYFPQRDLVAFSAAPLLLYPIHYTGERGYVSDTEDSTSIPSAFIEKSGPSSPSHQSIRDDL